MSTERLDIAAEVVQSLHTGVGIAGHAHPSAGCASSDDADHQYLQRLLANVTFHVELRGLAVHSNASPREMHYPRLRRSEFKQQAIEHLDVVSCWKGISNAQALELTLWERLFRTCLASLIEHDLRGRAIVHLSKVRGSVEDDELLPHLLRSLPSERSRLIKVNLPNLIRDIIDAFYNDHPSQTAARDFRWSLGSGDLPGFLYNYIATHDCLLRISDQLYVSANITLDYCTMPVVNVLARLHWKPPTVKFRSTPSQLERRGQYIIAPYREPDSSSYNRFPDTVDYTVTRSTSMVRWDIVGEVFRAQAPDTPTTSETLLQASVVTQFPENVRFKCISRYIVKVEVVDTLQAEAMLGKYRLREDASMPPTPPHTSGSWPKTHSLRSIRRHRDLGTGFLEALGKRRSDSPKKRKAPLRSTSYNGTSPVKLLHDKSATCLKRQKRELSSDVDVHASLVDLQNHKTTLEGCEAMLEALETLRQSMENRTSSDMRRPSVVALRLNIAVAPVLEVAHAAIEKELLDLSDLEDDDCSTFVKETELPAPVEIPVGRSPTPPHFAAEFDSTYGSASNSDSDASNRKITKPLIEASNTHFLHLAELSQDEIQKNYREFEEVAKRRKTDLTSRSGCEVGDMDFERIFLEDSEVEGVSGLSDGMDGLLMEDD